MVGIIGLGFVGTAIWETFTEKVTYGYDKYKKINFGELEDCELIFVCLPTPTRDGIQNIDAIEENLYILEEEKFKGVVVIKSTVLPGTCRYLNYMFPSLRIVHNPEFLCEKTAQKDFELQETILISGKVQQDCYVLHDFYNENLNEIKRIYIHDKYETTEWAKYIHNCILPIKLSFLNEVHREMNNQREFDMAISMAKHFGNLGYHNKVPGPDGKLGWGGSCFTKDTEALMVQYPSLKTLRAAIETNKEIRK